MENQDFENLIKKSLNIKAEPSRDDFLRLLSNLEDPVTEREEMRYNTSTAMPSNIISNKFAEFMAVWKTKHIILVPSLILLVLVGGFSLSKYRSMHNLSIDDLAQQAEQIEEQDFVDNSDYDVDYVDNQTFDELGSIQYEI